MGSTSKKFSKLWMRMEMDLLARKNSSICYYTLNLKNDIFATIFHRFYRQTEILTRPNPKLVFPLFSFEVSLTKSKTQLSFWSWKMCIFTCKSKDSSISFLVNTEKFYQKIIINAIIKVSKWNNQMISRKTFDLMNKLLAMMKKWDYCAGNKSNRMRVIEMWLHVNGLL